MKTSKFILALMATTILSTGYACADACPSSAECEPPFICDCSSSGKVLTKKINWNDTNSNIWTYTYDTGNRLISEKSQTYGLQYFSDIYTNITPSSDSQLYEEYISNFSYDEDGVSQTISSQEIYYNDENQISYMACYDYVNDIGNSIRFSNGRPYSLGGRMPWDDIGYYQYDDDGKLIALTGDSNGNNVLETYQYDDKGNLTATNADGQSIGTYANAMSMIGSRYIHLSEDTINSLRNATNTAIDRERKVYRIYTIDEANAVAGKTNSFKIRYR